MYPKKLKTGDTIGIIAPSSTIRVLSEDQINKGYDYLRNKGFRIKEHSQCRLDNQSLAGSIEDRVNAIHQYAQDDSIDCVMSFWGGWNTNQVIEYLDYDLIKKHPKIYIGYSDTCALLSPITAKTGLVTYMGPGAITFTKPDPVDYSWEYFDKMCIEKNQSVKIRPSGVYADDQYYLHDINKREIKDNKGPLMYRGGTVEGKVIASNLSTLLILLGTEYSPVLDNNILFIEEAEDSDYLAIKRMLTQARQTGIFKKIKGLVIGKFVEKSMFGLSVLRNTLDEVLFDTDYPVIIDANFGHSDPIFTIPNGGLCKIDADARSIEFIDF